MERRKNMKRTIRESDTWIEIEDQYHALEVEIKDNEFGFTIDWTGDYIGISKEHAKRVADFIYKHGGYNK